MDTYKGKVAFLILDYDDKDLSEYRRQYRIGAHPSFAVLRGDGEIVANFVGPVLTDLLEDAILKALG
jgi:hypothetical protein